MELSIIIPAYNEEKRIRRTLSVYLPFFLKKFGHRFELWVVLNGCKDNTLSVVRSFSRYKQLHILNIPEAIGKGGAIIEGFKCAKGQFVGFVDADCSTGPEAFFDLYTARHSADAILASRWIQGAIVSPPQTFFRILSSRVFNLLVRVFFRLPIYDTQCGAKLFSKNALKKILPTLGVTRWAFDVDLLYQLRTHGFKSVEIPTVWSDMHGSQLNLRKASIEMFFAVIRLRLLYSPFHFFISLYDRLPGGIKLHHYLK